MGSIYGVGFASVCHGYKKNLQYTGQVGLHNVRADTWFIVYVNVSSGGMF